ncbi:hypothetical protein GCM10022251_78790 [Phytohabitans flavus]|uniref:N-acetyltransferase domain-containing protein n=1 Tax=Phytohabitans flavus TaxID=1076124 RepID=A0A6F8XLT4_9ACTN|nr:GNAT family N-acetyltransferase [Phytohabitans flavus]BCB74749.1 hypothetical protein Pflav_011590 [Phytohabitans flavus]
MYRSGADTAPETAVCALPGGRSPEKLLLVRAGRVADLPMINDLHRRASHGSRLARYHSPREALRPAEWRLLTDPARGWTGVLVPQSAPGRLIGFGSVLRTATPGIVEASTFLVDEWQGLGVGEAFARCQLERARAMDARAVEGWIRPDNIKARRLAARLGLALTPATEGVLRVTMTIGDA